MPINVVTLSEGLPVLTIGGDVYGTFEVNKDNDASISAIPGAMTNVNFVMATGAATSGSVIKYSTTGSTWTDANLGNADFLSGGDIAYDGATTWVAVGNNNAYQGTIVYSSDNVNWSSINQPVVMGAKVAGVCYAPDTYWYAVGYDACGANTIIRSTNKSDPLLWDTAEGERLSPGSAYFGVYYFGSEAVGAAVASDGKHTIVAVGYASPTNSAILWADTNVNGKMWYNATFQDDSLIQYWSNQTSTVTEYAGVEGVAYNGNLWIATGDLGILASKDGKIWKPVANPQGFSGQCVAWNGQYWLVGGTSSVVGTSSIYYSYDGFAWEPSITPSGVNIQALCWNGTYWIAGGQLLNGFGQFSPEAPTSSFVTSTDGINWTGTAAGATGEEFDTQVDAVANRVVLPYSSLPGSVVTLTGSGAPAITLGNAGDFYYDRNTFGLYGPKTEYEDLGSNGGILFSESYGSLYADPSSDFLLNGDFTINFWMNAYSLQGAVFNVPSGLELPDNTGNFSISVITSNAIAIIIDASRDVISNSVTLNQWTYYTIVRSSTSGLMIYSNESNIYSNAGYNTNSIGTSTTGLFIGYGMNGLLTNFRWVNGYADPSAGEVPTAPFTSLSGTNLLLLAPVNLSGAAPEQSFIDATGNYTLTVAGNVLWSGDNPFQTTTLSWGTPIFPPVQRTTSKNFDGVGVPVYDPAGSQPGDTYTDTSTDPPTVYAIVAPINYGP
jgi:hypothetical protein